MTEDDGGKSIERIQRERAEIDDQISKLDEAARIRIKEAVLTFTPPTCNTEQEKIIAATLVAIRMFEDYMPGQLDPATWTLPVVEHVEENKEHSSFNLSSMFLKLKKKFQRKRQ